MDLLTNNNNCYSVESTTCVVRCLICNKSPSLPRKIHPVKVSEMYSDLLDVLCKYMKWTITSRYRFDFTNDAFPFCEKCVLFVVKLFKLHEQLEETREKINKVIIGISGRMLVSPKTSNVRKKVNVKSENGKVLHASKFMYVIGTEEKCEYYRRQLYRRFNPSVKLQVGKPGAPCQKMFVDCDSGLPEQPLPIELKLEVDPLSVSCGYDYEYQNVDLCSNQLNDNQITSLPSNDSEYPTMNNLYPSLAKYLLGTISIANNPDSNFSSDFISGLQQHEHRNIDFPAVDEQVVERPQPQPLVSEISDLNSSSKEVIGSNSKLNVCETCGKNFSRKSSLRRHQLLHTGDRLFCCELCGKCFKSSFDVRLHKAGAHFKISDKKFVCQVCGQKFERLDLLRTHSTKHDKIRCYICAQNVTKSLFKMHMRTHSTGKTFKCDCNKSFTSCWQFNSHLKNHGRISASHMHMCDICGNKFCSKFSLQRHHLLHRDNGPFHCDLCGMSFKFSSTMKRHNTLAHLTIRRNIRRKINIQNCDRKPSLEGHASISSSHNCDICGKWFPQKYNIIRHKKSVHAIMKEETEGATDRDNLQGDHESLVKNQAGQYYIANNMKNSDKPSLEASDLVCSSESIFECPKCPKSFASYSGLDHHLKVHTRCKEFPCHLCSRIFSRRISLIQHGEKHHNLNKETEHGKSNSSFQSDVNSVVQDEIKLTKNLYVVKNDDNMPPKLHGLVDSSKTIFQCSKCDSEFSSPYKLTRHLKSHDNQFSCDVCGRHFYQKYNLTRHKKKLDHYSEMPLTVPSSDHD